MKPASFTYHRARDVADAGALLAELGDEAKVIAGGQSLVAMMNFRLARPQHLVDIGGVADLSHIRREGQSLHIGALTTHHAVEKATDAQLGAGYEILRDAMAWVGHLPIRTRGTVGGSLAHGDPVAEWCLLAVLLDAHVIAQGPAGERSIPVAELLLGFYSTTLAPAELIVELVFPRPAPHSALAEFAERRGDFATVAAAVNLELAPESAATPGGRVVLGGQVVLGGVAPTPFRATAAEAVLGRGVVASPELFAAAAAAAAAAIEPEGDANGSAEYRRKLATSLIKRACEEAVSR